MHPYVSEHQARTHHEDLLREAVHERLAAGARRPRRPRRAPRLRPGTVLRSLRRAPRPA